MRGLGWDLGRKLTAPLDTRITSLEDTYVRACWFEEITSGTSGTLTLPTGGGVVLNQWEGSVDALASKVSSNWPSFESPVNAGGTVITATLDTSGNWSLSDAPSSYPVAIIYIYRVKLVSFDDAYSMFEAELEPVDVAANTAARHTQGTDTTLGTQTQSLNMNTHKIAGVVDPTADQEAATKKYVDDNSINNVVEDTTPQLGGTLDGQGNTIENIIGIILQKLAAGAPYYIRCYSDTNDHGATTIFQKSHQDTEGYTATVDGEKLGIILAWGTRSTNDEWGYGAKIEFIQDGSAGTIGIPTKTVFKTSPGGATYPVERMKIAPDGGLHIAGMKGAVDQATAGAVAGELWYDTNDDNTVKMGV